MAGYSEAQHISRWNGLECCLIALKMSHHIDKSMALHNKWIRWWFSARWLPVKANQWHLMNTRTLVDVWQASGTSLKKSRPVNFRQWCCDSWLAYWWSFGLAMKNILFHYVCMWWVLVNLVTIYNATAISTTLFINYVISITLASFNGFWLYKVSY